MGLEQYKWRYLVSMGLIVVMGASMLSGCEYLPAFSDTSSQSESPSIETESTQAPTETGADDEMWVDMTDSPDPGSGEDQQSQSPEPAETNPSVNTADPDTSPSVDPSSGVDVVELTTPIPPASGDIKIPGYGAVAASSLNVRIQPDSGAEIIYGLFANAIVRVIEETGDWYRVQVGDIIGYVKKEFITPSDGQLRPTQEEVYFYDDIVGEFTTKAKSFYWVIYGGNPRRFDARVPSECFEYAEDGSLVISKDIRSLTQNMGKALYNSDLFSVNCYFGQYYPSAKKEDGTVYETGIHEGIDFGGPELDSEFYSLTDGVVTSVNNSRDNTKYAWIGVKTGDYTLFYVHQRTSYVKVGDEVKKGDRLGKQGDIGAPGSSHVHLGFAEGDTDTFARSKDTNLTDALPYDFFKEQGY